MAAPVLRPLGIGEIFDVAINIYRRHAWTLCRVVLFVVAPVNALSVIVQASAIPDDSGFAIDNQTGNVSIDEQDFAVAAAGASVAGILTFVATILASGASFKAIADAYLGERPDWQRSLKFALRRIHSIVWVTFLGAFIAVLGLILLIVPGVYLWTAFGVAVPVLLTEGLKGRKALGRSRRLVRGRWWSVFAVLLLGAILTSVVSGALGGVVGALTFVDTSGDSFVSLVAQFLSSTISNVLTLPFTAAFVIVLYFDLRVRKEGFDLQLLAQQIGVEPSSGLARAPYEPTPEPEPWGGAEPSGGDQPPFWPPPPGWKPRTGPRDGE